MAGLTPDDLNKFLLFNGSFLAQSLIHDDTDNAPWGPQKLAIDNLRAISKFVQLIKDALVDNYSGDEAHAFRNLFHDINKVDEISTFVQKLQTALSDPNNLSRDFTSILKLVLSQLFSGAVAPNATAAIVPSDVDNLIKNLETYLQPLVDNLAKVLQIQLPGHPTAIDLHQDLRKVSAALSFSNIFEHISDSNLETLRSTGALPGVEFGYFDITASGVHSVRLSPLPLPAVPPPVHTLLGFLAYGPIAALAGAFAEYGPVLTAEILYSAFPGYPGFFDVPVEEGVLSTSLTSRGNGTLSNNKPLPDWPTSGSLLPLDPGNFVTFKIRANYNTYFEENFGSPSTSSGTVFNFEFKSDNFALPTLNVVRPAGLAFPDRLIHPVPVVISDPRQFRTFLLLPKQKSEVFNTRISSWDWRAAPLYHSEAGRFLRFANRDGILRLYESSAAGGALQDGEHKNGFDESFIVPTQSIGSNMKPPTVASEECSEEIHYSGGVGLYNWELFFHLPLRFAQQLAADLQFSEANAWLRRVFDPTFVRGAPPARFWRFKALFDEASASRPDSIDTILTNAAGLATAIDQWQSNPTDADAIAQTRNGAYQRSTVMQTIDILVAWGDRLFMENTPESINEAALLYLTASGILGKRPPETALPRPKPLSYNALSKEIQEGTAIFNAFWGARVALENWLVSSPDGANPGAGSTGQEKSPALGPVAGRSMFYFAVPANDQLRGYWDTIADRLYKIRHSLDIQGQPRPGMGGPGSLGLPGPAGKMGAASPWAMAGTGSPTPLYRFSFALQKANEFCGEVKALGGALLSACEKRDAEALANLRSGHEIVLLKLAEQVRIRQVEEAGAAVAAAEFSLKGAEIRRDYYERLSGEFMNAVEVIKEGLSIASSVFQVGSGVAELAAASVHAMPDFGVDMGLDIGAVKVSGKPNYKYNYGASHIAAAISAGGKVLSNTASVLGIFSSLAGTVATYQRRREEWLHQRDLARNDEDLYKQQIESAQIRLQIAQTELQNHRRQIANAQEVATFMREKFSNQELYQWMVEGLSRTYLQTYQMAYNLASAAQLSYQHENPDDKIAYITQPNWEFLGPVLLAGETLQLQLRQMENSWLSKNVRDAELVKNISLHQHDPIALIQLRQTGMCMVNLPEQLFDEDHPGQYMRRIKSVSLTIPCVTGPYTGVNCRLTLTGSRIRVSPDPKIDSNEEHYTEHVSNNQKDARFDYRTGTNPSILTSSAQNDAGLFEVNLRDERYLPFEGEGAISEWKLELPIETNRFDFASISDIVIHLRYTARDAKDDNLRLAAERATFGHVLDGSTSTVSSDFTPPTRMQLFSARVEFSDAWYRFTRAATGPGAGASVHLLELELGTPRFPFTTPDRKIELISIEAVLLGSTNIGTGWSGKWSLLEIGTDASGEPITREFTPQAELSGLYASKISAGDWGARNPFYRWRITLDGPHGDVALDLTDMLILCEYRLVPKDTV